MTDPVNGTVSVALDEGGGIGISLSASDQPVELLRRAADALERYAASIERESAPVRCAVCGTLATGAEAAPAGPWRLLPCGHGTTSADSPRRDV